MSFHIIRNFSIDRYKINEHTVYFTQKPLTQRWKKGFEVAKLASLNSDGKAVGSKMGASLFSGNRLLATGHNLYSKTRPGNTHRKENGVIYNTSTHAEQMAIDQIKHYDYNNLNLILYIVRLDAFGNFVTSRPCSICIDAMKKYGIKKARFINNVGAPEELILK